jgi:adenine/guanine/hypoxanthine permease
MNNNLNTKISSYFEFGKYNTNLRTEILAGISTYLSLAYIFILNPAIMSGLNGGSANANNPIDVSAILFATIIASGLSTLAMGIWAKLPFALAPGLEMNGFFAIVVCGILGLTW